MENKIYWHLYNADNEIKMEFPSSEEAIEFLKKDPQAKEYYCWREGFEDWLLVSKTPEFSAAFEIEKITPPKAAPQPPPLPVKAAESTFEDEKTPQENPYFLEDYQPKSGPILVPIDPPSEIAEVITAVTEVSQSNEIKNPVTDSPLAPSEPTSPTLHAVQTQEKPKTSPQNRKHERFDLRLRVILRSQQITFRTFSKNISLGGIATEHPIPRDLINEDCTIYIANPDGQENIKFNVKFATERQDTKYFYFTEISPNTQDKLQNWIDKFSKKIKIPA